MIKGYLEYISKVINSHSSKYDNLLLLGDFNSEPTERFCQIRNLKNLLDKLICYINPTNPSRVNLIITNKYRSFQNSCTFKTVLSKFHKMSLKVLKSSFKNRLQKPRVLNYRNYIFFNNTLFRDQVLRKLRNSDLQIKDKDLNHFKETYQSVLNTIVPLKSRFIQANQTLFINKETQRAVMVRSKL